MAGTYGEPGKNPFTVKGIAGILSPVVNGTTGVTQVYRQGAANTYQSLGTYNPTTNKFTADPNAGSLTQNEIKALSSEESIKTIKNSASTTVSKGVQAAGGTPAAGQKTANGLLSPNKAQQGATGDGTAPVDLKIESTGKKEGFGNHRYPLDLDKSKQDKIKFSMLQYSPRGFQSGTGNLGGLSERSKQRSILGTVTLPIPSGISESNTTGWGEQTMTPLEAALANSSLSAIAGGGEQAAKTAEQIIQDVTKNSNDVKTAVAAKIAGAATGVTGLLSRTQGAVINPNLELLFNGPALRPFNFTFKMSARSEAEAKQIIKIIRFFKQGMAPQKSTSNLFIKAPHTFKIQYLLGSSKDKNHPFIGQIKECALQSFVVNYTPEGQYSTFYDGPMVSYEIQMTLQELEPVFNEDYGTGGSDLPENLLFKE